MGTLGERLAFARKNILNMNQKTFSELIGISQGALSDTENNNRGLSMEAIIEIIKYSKTDNRISGEWILTGENNTNENLCNEERELIQTYNLLDSRGQHKIHTVIYEELDRIKAESQNAVKKDFQTDAEADNSISKMARNNNLVRK